VHLPVSFIPIRIIPDPSAICIAPIFVAITLQPRAYVEPQPFFVCFSSSIQASHPPQTCASI